MFQFEVAGDVVCRVQSKGVQSDVLAGPCASLEPYGSRTLDAVVRPTPRNVPAVAVTQDPGLSRISAWGFDAGWIHRRGSDRIRLPKDTTRLVLQY